MANLPRQFGVLHNARIAGCRRLKHFRFRQRVVDVLGDAHALRAAVHLPDEFRLALQYLPASRVQRPFGDVAQNVDLFVEVALTQNAPVALLDLRRLMRRVHVVHGDQALLRVRADAHLLRRSDQHARHAVVHACEQSALLLVAVGVVNELNLLAGDAGLHEPLAHVLIEIDRRRLAARALVLRDDGAKCLLFSFRQFVPRTLPVAVLDVLRRSRRARPIHALIAGHGVPGRGVAFIALGDLRLRRAAIHKHHLRARVRIIFVAVVDVLDVLDRERDLSVRVELHRLWNRESHDVAISQQPTVERSLVASAHERQRVVLALLAPQALDLGQALHDAPHGGFLVLGKLGGVNLNARLPVARHQRRAWQVQLLCRLRVGDLRIERDQFGDVDELRKRRDVFDRPAIGRHLRLRHDLA